jgi:L-gulono-1,4-lactone dehydrogenase
MNKSLLMMALALGLGGHWQNWQKTEQVNPAFLNQPASARELCNNIALATSFGLRARMTGSGHSASDVAVTNEVLLTPEKLNQPLTIDGTRLKNPIPVGLVRVQSGIKLSDLNTWLDSHGRALLNMGGYDGQTIAGVMMTATHGSGPAYGPMADFVVSLQMVVEGGKMVQIEPTNGITNPATWPGTLEEDASTPITLIQDDDTFNAARVSLGSMGVVYSVVINTDQKFWLREVRRLIKWSELKKPGGYLDRALHGLPVYPDKPSPEHFEFQYSPYADANGDHSFLITERYHSYSPLPEQPSSARGQPGTDFSSTLVALFGQPLAVILDTFPGIAKIALETALSDEVEDSWTNVSYRVFNVGVVNYTDAIAIEAAFDMSQTVAAVERSFQVADALFAQGVVHSSPMSVRFVKSTDALLATQQGRPTVFLEIIGLGASKNIRTLLNTHQQTYMREFGARPHWGLDLNTITNEAQLRALYPRYDAWKAIYLRFNAGTFDGKVTDRLGISVRPRI